MLEHTPAQVFWFHMQHVSDESASRLHQMYDHMATFGPMVAGKDAKLDAFVAEHRGNLAKLAGLATQKNNPTS